MRPAPQLYPFTSHYLETRGMRLHYLDEGPPDAPPVLMLHGNPTWSFYYRNLVIALRERYRCIVPDHLGCGLSAMRTGSRAASFSPRRLFPCRKARKCRRR
jgi:pimeloyl-ACP methyl ester carboxylesterase